MDHAQAVFFGRISQRADTTAGEVTAHIAIP